MKNEIWKDIKGFEGKYQISNFGRLKSLPRKIGNGNGYFKKENFPKLGKDKDGYFQYGFPTSNRRHVTYKIHKLVAIHFISDHLPIGYHICHKDGNKENNIVENLYIGDSLTNMLDRYKHGVTKLSISDIIEIRKATGTQKEIGEKYGVLQNTISRIKSGKRSRCVPNEQLSAF